MQLLVSNCPKCGNVFQKNIRNLCHNCQQELDGELNKCEDYLRKYRKASTDELSEATGVHVRHIYAFIKENRLPLSFFPSLTYPCKSCAAPIRQNHLCTACRGRIISDIHKMKEQEAKHKERGLGFQIRNRIGI